MTKLTKIIAEKLGLSEDQITDETAYGVALNWDSITHLEITSEIEEVFGVEFDVDEITAMANVKAIKEILSKHGVSNI